MSDTDIGAELGAPGHPAVDQLEAAVAEVNTRAAKLPASTAVFRVGSDELPEQLHHFARLHHGEFADRTMRKCEHGGNAQASTVVPSFAPNVLLCDQCAPPKLYMAFAQRAHVAKTGSLMPCDVCGTPERASCLRQFGLAHGHILILGVGCGRCLQV